MNHPKQEEDEGQGQPASHIRLLFKANQGPTAKEDSHRRESAEDFSSEEEGKEEGTEER